MFGSRTIKTLAALVTAMTIGTLALMLLETAPIRPTVQNLAALAPRDHIQDNLIRRTEIPLQAAKWQNIIVHSSAGQRSGFEQRCHFIIELGEAGEPIIRSTQLWSTQQAGSHTNLAGYDWNRNSIAICVVGDFSSQRPGQVYDATVLLTQALQKTFHIGRDRVYRYGQLNPASDSPGRLWPAEFENVLLQ